MITTATQALMAAAFGSDTEPIEPDYCVGNSHALIAYERSSSTADCACGTALIRLTDGRWVHGVNLSALCPPYECECGKRHNQGHPTSPVRRAN